MRQKKVTIHILYVAQERLRQAIRDLEQGKGTPPGNKAIYQKMMDMGLARDLEQEAEMAA